MHEKLPPEIYRNTKGTLSTIVHCLTRGRKVMEYTRKKVLIPHEHRFPFDGMPQTMEGDMEVNYILTAFRIIDNPQNIAK